MMQRSCARLRVLMTSALCGFTRFFIIRKPRKRMSVSTSPLQRDGRVKEHAQAGFLSPSYECCTGMGDGNLKIHKNKTSHLQKNKKNICLLEERQQTLVAVGFFS